MAVRIVVEKGPDQGKALVLDTRAEMRIGRGPGNHLMVQDPNWQGSLRVSFKQGVCKVTNQTPTTIYLGGKTFPPGEQRAWFHGESLQPTAQTLLVLYVEDANKATAEKKTPSGSRKAMQLAIILLCLPVAALLFFAPSPQSTDEPLTADQRGTQYQRLERELQELRGNAAAGGAAGRILTLLKEARFEQQRGHVAQAYTLYLRVREEVETDLGTPINPRAVPEEIADVLRRVRVFVNQQLLELAPQAKKLSS
jgi:hypothetical protein